MKRGIFEIKVKFEEQRIIDKRCNRVEDIERITRGLKKKFS